PWAGPLGRAASVLDMDVTELWRPLIPIQIIGMVLILLLAAFLGYMEKRRIEKKYGSSTIALDETRDLQAEGEKPKLLWANLLLNNLVIIMVVWGVISGRLIFMITVSNALIMKYRTAEKQNNSIKNNAASALTMGTIILAAGSFLGNLSGTGMLDSI